MREGSNLISTYTTISGDMWDLISWKVYGSEKMTRHLQAANPELLKIVRFPAGVVVKCPDIKTEQGEDLPPWMQD